MENLAHHIPVLLEATLRPLLATQGSLFVDATLGGGGHAGVLLERLPQATVYGCDRDAAALERVAKRFPQHISSGRLKLLHTRFGELDQALHASGIYEVDGIMADLGFSSFQVDEAERGFSFRLEGPLDMRMDQSKGKTAADIINTWDRELLQNLFSQFGEERYSGRISYAIARQRAISPLRTTLELAELIKDAVPKQKGKAGSIHPATRVFQALRIQVNDELGDLERFLGLFPSLIKVGGATSVITFHSLEDRRVKLRFRELSADCVCPPAILSCERCHNPPAKLFYRKAVAATEEEVAENPRARSAKVRAIQRLR